MFLVTGATGNVGGELEPSARLLLRNPAAG